MDGVAGAKRDVQLQASECWCENPSYWTKAGGDGFETLLVDEHDARGMWCTVVFPRMDLSQAKSLVEDIGLLLPPDTWYYGCREDHECVSVEGVHFIHACVVLLVGFAEPRKVGHLGQMVRQRLSSWLGGLAWAGGDVALSSCPSHLSVDGAPAFWPVVRWVQSRIAFIDAASVVSPGGLKRGVFGRRGILTVLRKQYGSAWNPLVREMACAKQMSDEEDGVLTGRFAPGLVEPYGQRETIYVDTSPIECS